MALDILIVDDEADIRMLVGEILRDEGYECREAGTSEEAFAAVAARRPTLVVLDIWLRGSELDGMQILESLTREHPGLPVVMISGHGTIETAVRAIKLGAYDFVEKPFKADRLVLTIERAIDAARLRRENAELRQRFEGEWELIGASPAATQLRNAVERVARSDSRVLITGPAGAGKEVIARMIHARSKRCGGPFVVLNCAAMAPERMEIELFGALSDPRNPDHPPLVGTFEEAHGGTLLLDEVSDMPMATQGKIVRVLQEQSFFRVDGGQRVRVDVRVLATTSRDLESEMAAGRFRQDLFYRLNVVPISVPALTQRRTDIPDMIAHFSEFSAAVAGVQPRNFSPDAIAALQSYGWPGNVRQLRNVVDWVMIMAPEGSGPVHADALPPEIMATGPVALPADPGSEVMALPLREAREVFERQYLLAQVDRFGGNISRTAHFVGMERSALHRKLKLLGLNTGRPVDTSV